MAWIFPVEANKMDTPSPAMEVDVPIAEKSMNQDKPKVRVFREFPAVNKDNFKKYHQPDEPIHVIERNYMQRQSIYPTTSETTLEQRIVNDAKPQVTLRYMCVRGKQYKKEKAIHKEKRQRLLLRANN